MTKLFLVKDKSDAHYKKPFVSIHEKQTDAETKIRQLRSKVNIKSQPLIDMDSVDVKDYDPNKKSLYVVFDKTDKNAAKPFVSMHSSVNNATDVITKLRKGLPTHAHKLVYVSVESVA